MLEAKEREIKRKIGNPPKRLDRDLSKLSDQLAEKYGIRTYEFRNAAFTYGLLYLASLDDRRKVEDAVKNARIFKSVVVTRAQATKEVLEIGNAIGEVEKG